MASKVTGVIIAVLAIALVGTLIYMGNVSSTYSQQLEEKNKKIASLEAELNKLKSELASAKEAKPTTTETKQAPTKVVTQINCADCHGDVSTFHQIEKLMKVDKAKGIEPPRICTTCHGEKIHKIHERKIEERGVEMCKFCHMTKEGDFRVPQKRPGDILVCQVCHFDGNYIKIHKAKCERCHYGKANEIHKPILEKRYEEIASL